MCTLTYIPHENGGFQITSNRDESPKRKTADKPAVHRYKNRDLLFPKDEKHGGSWIACSQNGTTHCLLNGAFQQHKHNPPYKKSRGLVLLDSLLYESLKAFGSDYDFSGIEPFTLVAFHTEQSQPIEEIRYDGNELHYTTPDAAKPHIWSSAQLYKPEVIEQRKQLFIDLINKHPQPGFSEMMDFHRFGKVGDPWNDFIMNRNDRVKTVSITSVTAGGGREVSMYYRDLLANKTHETNFNISR